MYPGLLAGGSLLVDYILTVAVSVSAGTDAITSAFPSLHEQTVMIAVAFVVFLTLLNLRGVRESASILAYPVYLFVLALLILIGAGIYNVITGKLPPDLHAPIGTPVAGISLFLLLRAFASGSSALTGVEAISNAIPNFKDPAPKNAAKTLMAMGTLLAVLFDCPETRGYRSLTDRRADLRPELHVLLHSRNDGIDLNPCREYRVLGFPAACR